MSGSTPFLPTERTRVRRLPARASYEREDIYRILDEALICQVGFVVDQRVSVIPTAYGRSGDTLYLHGSPLSRMLKALQSGIDVCLSVTLVDGLVLARSAMHHSLNYRSVVIYGRATLVSDPEEKTEALRVFTEHVVPGRWAEVRPPNPAELAGTVVLALPLLEVSAKTRSGPPNDDPEDCDWPVWAGVLPLTLGSGTAESDPQLHPAYALPAYLQQYRRGG